MTEKTKSVDSNLECIEFRKDLYFFNLVSCFSVSLCGSPIIFDNRVEMFLPPDHSLSFPGRFVSNKVMAPHSLRVRAERGEINRSEHMVSCCIMLANTAYESVKEFNDGSETFEFFRHIRNASSHLNTFQFIHKEPVKPARWRYAVIADNLKGERNPLYGQRCFGNFLGVADILELLIDVEQIIIKQLTSTKNSDI
ncbi:hypothetical protein L3081_06295 [Colwellia sp. MSW7]|uniref:Uncharacterized protein n=1 Tax=Colwellia maritima TaxID=2912588 RepID=A0ABS9WYK3_9GAMM|nr:hypothetical protein [Colwellia maritima]MCI2283079.1 hypothetical protein [Colwellia maritima]